MFDIISISFIAQLRTLICRRVFNIYPLKDILYFLFNSELFEEQRNYR